MQKCVEPKQKYTATEQQYLGGGTNRGTKEGYKGGYKEGVTKEGLQRGVTKDV